MKKNTILYLLLLFLIIVNGFFLFSYIGRPVHKDPKEASNFIAKELSFNEAQLKQFNALEAAHHEKMEVFGEGIKNIKDQLFENITASTLNNTKKDSLINLIAKQEAVIENEMFSRLRSVYEICNDKQKKHFNEILIKARGFGGNGPGKPRG